MRLLVLGGGPAGVSAALQARELGADVTLVEANRVGGTILSDGPAPVRTLARAARLVRDAGSWERFGLRGDAPEVDVTAALANAKRVADYAHEQRQMADVIRRQGVDLIDAAGPARFVDPHTVAVSDGRAFAGDAVVVAVGGRPARPNIPGAELALTYSDLRTLREVPAAVAVVGGADTGCQLASILADFGATVSLLEGSPRLVPRSDSDVSAGLADSFRDRGIQVRTETLVERLEPTPTGVTVRYRTAEAAAQLDVDLVFFAVGWPGNADQLEAAAIGVASERGYLTVDEHLRTNVAHIYAAGDINGLSMLVPSARHEGRIAAENAVLGTDRRFTHDIVPVGSFTDPEYASVGLTEAEARDRYDCEVAVVRYDNVLRAVADARSEGFCKLIVDRHRHNVLGAHVLGEYSAEVIQTVATCMAQDMRVEQIAELQLAYPTFTEAVGMAAQRIVRALGVAPMHLSWSDLSPVVDPGDDVS